MVEKDINSCDFEEIMLNTKFHNALVKGVRNIFILWLISKEKIHGYGIMSILNKTHSDMSGKKAVHSSTIYPILHTLEKDGLIKSSQELNGNHKVKMYEITNKGLKMLDSLKQFMNKKRPENNMLISFFDDMLFNDNMFIKK